MKTWHLGQLHSNCQDDERAALRARRPMKTEVYLITHFTGDGSSNSSSWVRHRKPSTELYMSASFMNGKGSTWKKTLLNIKKWVVERKVTECGVFPMSDHLRLPIWSQYANVKWNLDEDDDVKWNCDDDNDGDNVIPMMAYCDHLFVTSSPTAMSLTARTHTLWSKRWQIRVFTWYQDQHQD